MKILAIDTSTRSGSVALLDNGNLVREITAADAGTHASWLMPSISALLEGTGTEVSSVDVFALTTGPGSFTGLRIGVSTVKGLAWTSGKKVFAVSTLAALALNLRYSSFTVCPVLDARKGELYAALYRFNGGCIETVLKDAAIAPLELIRLLSSGEVPTGKVAFLGNGAGAHRELLESVKGAFIAPEPLWHIRASNVALIANERIMSGEEPMEAAGITPVYLRKSEAEIKSRSQGAA